MCGMCGMTRGNNLVLTRCVSTIVWHQKVSKTLTWFFSGLRFMYNIPYLDWRMVPSQEKTVWVFYPLRLAPITHRSRVNNHGPMDPLEWHLPLEVISKSFQLYPQVSRTWLYLECLQWFSHIRNIWCTRPLPLLHVLSDSCTITSKQCNTSMKFVMLNFFLVYPPSDHRRSIKMSDETSKPVGESPRQYKMVRWVTLLI